MTDNEFEFATITTNEVVRWSPGEVHRLIDNFQKNTSNFDRFSRKKVWDDISTAILSIRGRRFTGDQCNGKWKGLKSMYKKVKEHNNISGNSTKKWEYFDAMDEVLFRRPEVNLPAICSSGAAHKIVNAPVVRNTEHEQTDINGFDFVDIIEDQTQILNTNSSLHRKRKNKLIDAEESKEKRHKDKMQRTDRFLDLFETLVNKIN